MKRVYIATIATCLIVALLFFGGYRLLGVSGERELLRVGFICDSDESTPYTYNFLLARDALEKKYGDRVEVFTRNNVPEGETEEPLRELVGRGCDVIFLNGYSAQVVELAAEYPDVEFCQVSYEDMSGRAVPANYHTFKGEIYQGRYVTGIAAGMKLREMIDSGELAADEALIGFVAAFETPEVISGYTAFLLGARSIVPEVTMRVRYTGTWGSYSLEKRAAQALIDEGCRVLSQHTDTIAPAIACEEAQLERTVYFVGYNQSMRNVATSASLVATRINWEPYVVAAAEAVMKYRPIEKSVSGKARGTDMFAGFDRGWVELVDLNDRLAAEGTREAVNDAIERLRRGGTEYVYQCELTGVDPDDPGDTVDLSKGYAENAASSYPTFHYLIEDIVTVEE